MAVKGQTHAKRARELARKERREHKQAKKEARAAGNAPAEDAANDGDAAERPEAGPGWIQ